MALKWWAKNKRRIDEESGLRERWRRPVWPSGENAAEVVGWATDLRKGERVKTAGKFHFGEPGLSGAGGWGEEVAARACCAWSTVQLISWRRLPLPISALRLEAGLVLSLLSTATLACSCAANFVPPFPSLYVGRPALRIYPMTFDSARR